MPPYLQRTLVILKPDALERGLAGKILARFEAKGLKILACRVETLSREDLEKHYAEHEGKPFYDDLVNFMSGGPSMLLALEGLDAITNCRLLMGNQSLPGTIRGDWAQHVSYNLVHGSDWTTSAQRELDIFFPGLTDPSMTPSAPRKSDCWLFGPDPEYQVLKEDLAEKALRLSQPFRTEN